jgi:hypothetical protein
MMATTGAGRVTGDKDRLHFGMTEVFLVAMAFYGDIIF